MPSTGGERRRSHTLYLDETGDRGLVNFNPRYPVLGLCGVIVEDEVYRDLQHPRRSQPRHRAAARWTRAGAESRSLEPAPAR